MVCEGVEKVSQLVTTELHALKKKGKERKKTETILKRSNHHPSQVDLQAQLLGLRHHFRIVIQKVLQAAE